VDQALAQRAGSYVQAISEAVRACPWPAIEEATGATSSTLKETARAFAAAARTVILVGQDVLRAPRGSGIATNLLDLLLLTGKHGQPGCGLAPLAEENNDQGAVEMGTVAEFLPGPSDLNNRPARDRIAGLWKEELPQGAGRTLMEMLEEARAGKLKSMLIIGENPVGSLPTAARAREALEQLDFLVCQELFLTETAALADVVLPACSYAEKDGTVTNTEGHVQQVRQAIEPIGESRPDWEILSALSVLMGYPLEYGESREILKEIRSLIPGYGLLGPTPTPPRLDQTVVDRYLREDYAEDLASRYALADEGQAARGSKKEGGFTLVVGQTLFHSGKLSTRAKGLLQIQAAGFLGLNPANAQQIRVADGDRVRISNEQGEMTTTVKLLDRVPEGLALFPEHFAEDARRLLRLSTDPQTGVPSYRTAQVKIERI